MFSKPSKIGDFLWEIPQSGKMRVPARIYGTEKIIKETEEEAITARQTLYDAKQKKGYQTVL